MDNNEILIVGAGLTGLSLAHFLKKNGHKAIIADKAEQPGGVIQTFSENGFVYESGPNTGVLSSFELVSLFEDLKGSVTLETARKEAEKRYVMKNGRWEALPSGLLSAIRTPLFTFGDKLRILGEPFRKPGSNPDETVAELVVRRLGRSYLEYAVDPFISGIYAGDPGSLVTRYALPKLYALEQNYGSFIKGSVAKARVKKTGDDLKVTKKVFSTEGGLGNLVNALVEGIGDNSIKCGVSELKVMPHGKGFHVSFIDKSRSLTEGIFSKVITTAGGYSLKTLLPFIDNDDIEPILRLRYAKVVQVSAGFRSWNGSDLDAFGALVPGKEKKEILGILFPSAIFKRRAPEGGALLSVFMGGIRKPHIYDMSDNEVFDIVRKEIRETLFTDQAPDLLKIFRYEHAIPQYEITSGARFEAISRIENKYPGLILAGNIRDGIGMSDRVKQAKRIADIISSETN